MSPSLPRLKMFVVAVFVAGLVALQTGVAHACTGTLSVSSAGPAELLPGEAPQPGTALLVDGAAFAPGPVVVYWGEAGGELLGEANADRRGRFSIEVTVPETAGAPARIVAESRQASSTGFPSTGWVDLGPAETLTGPPAGVPEASAAAPEGTAGEGTGFEGTVGGSVPVPARYAVLLILGAVLAVAVPGATVMVGVMRRRARGRSADRSVDPDLEPVLDRELADLLDSQRTSTAGSWAQPR